MFRKNVVAMPSRVTDQSVFEQREGSLRLTAHYYLAKMINIAPSFLSMSKYIPLRNDKIDDWNYVKCKKRYKTPQRGFPTTLLLNAYDRQESIYFNCLDKQTGTNTSCIVE